MFEEERDTLARELKQYPMEYRKRDLSSVYGCRNLMDRIVRFLAGPYQGKVDYVAAPEPSGSVVGSLLARELGVGFLPIRKADGNRIEESDRIAASYIDHNNQVKTLEVRKSTFPENSRILLADDWVETAATMQTCTTIVEETMGVVEGIVSIGAGSAEVVEKMTESGFLTSVIRKTTE